jgi:peptidoglycan/LPS O-acetylase OafA/YrhL
MDPEQGWILRVRKDGDMIYRPEIDGLRAVAVVPVILFHAGLTGFSGGFVGVDVFFVISGYLITTIILIDLAQGRFSIARFYERRARRILPALTVVLLACLPFSWAWMMPRELELFGKSLISTAMFGSNIQFWRESGYFDTATDLKPLLHTWSLAVEEQFYLIFPLVLAVIWRWRRGLAMPALLVVGLASLILAEWGARNAPSANFYLLPSRIWEFLIGALVATRHIRMSGTIAPRVLAECGGFAGLGLIIYAVFNFDATSAMPSLLTLIPAGGTALVLGLAQSGTIVARLLSWRPLVGIGLISYSAYLWHQPVLAFARIRLISSPEGGVMVVLLAATFGLAWISWRYVERPFRGTAALLPGGWRIGIASLSSIGAACMIGAVLLAGNGFGGRLSPAGLRFDSVAGMQEPLAPNYGLNADCDAGRFVTPATCSLSDRPEIALWGDSYAMHLAQAMRYSASARPFIQLTLSQCGPIPGLAQNGTLTAWQSCISFNDEALVWILAHESIEVVVLSSPFGQADAGLFTRNGSMVLGRETRQTAMAVSLDNLALEMAAAGKRLVIVSPPPRTGLDLGLCYMRSRLMGLAPNSCDFPQTVDLIHNPLPHDLLQRLELRAPVIWLKDLLCQSGICRTYLDGVPLYRDTGHLSVAGSARLGAEADLAGLVLSAKHP